MTTFRTALIAAALLTITAASAATAPHQPKRVLIIHSYLPEFEGGFGDKLRDELDRQLAGQLDLYENWLVSARFATEGEDAGFANYLTTAFADRPIDLIIAIGTPAANFFQRYAKTLFPSIPEVLTVVQERRLALFRLQDNQVAVPYSGTEQTTVDEILRLLPRTTNVALLMGDSPIERYFAEQLRAAARPQSRDLTVTSLSSLPTFDDVLHRMATLPPRSVIYFEPLFSDMQGMPSDELAALAKLHAVANAPIFSAQADYFGSGIVGGSMLVYDEYARETVSVATRLLRGERPSDIKPPAIRPQRPRFDSRELKRWGIEETRLPPASKIDFQEPTVWQRYPREIAGAAALILLQGALILGLLYERGRRRSAEIEAHRRLFELARMNRRSAVGELSGSIAHELYQPLTAIVANVEAAEQMQPLMSEDLRGILLDVKNDVLRAGEVIARLRRMLANSPVETQELDLNEVVKETLKFLSAQASARGVTLRQGLTPQGPRVIGDRIQLQQVILNLVLNAMDAMANAGNGIILARTVVSDDTWVEVLVEDSGPGIPVDKLEQIFEPFFTTKEAGMGMGLSVARSIIVNLGGKIRAENLRGGGAVFRFSLPLARSKPAVAADEPAGR